MAGSPETRSTKTRSRRMVGTTALVAAVGIGGLVLGGAVSTAWGSAWDSNSTTGTQASSDTQIPNDTQAPDATAPDTSTPDTMAPDGTAPDSSQFDAYRQCMKDNGVDLPDPGTRPDHAGRGPRGGPDQTPPSDADRATHEAAEKACEDKLPDAVRQRRADREAKMQAFAQCMKDNGVDLPTPTPGEGKPALPQVDEQTLKNALDACRSILPEGGPGGPGHHGGPGGFGGPGGPGHHGGPGSGQGTAPGDGSSGDGGSSGDSQTPPSTDAPSTDTTVTNSSFHFAA